MAKPSKSTSTTSIPAAPPVEADASAKAPDMLGGAAEPGKVSPPQATDMSADPATKAPPVEADASAKAPDPTAEIRGELATLEGDLLAPVKALVCERHEMKSDLDDFVRDQNHELNVLDVKIRRVKEACEANIRRRNELLRQLATLGG